MKLPLRMLLSDKSAIYKSRFPAIIAERMASQVDHFPVSEHDDNQWLLLWFCDWPETEEGDAFWSSIEELYRKGEVPSEEMILEVFVKYEIEP